PPLVPEHLLTSPGFSGALRGLCQARALPSRLLALPLRAGRIARGGPMPGVARQQHLRLRRTPGARLVAVDRRRVGAQYRIDDGPRGLDGVLTREQRGIARHRVTDQPLVGPALSRVLVAHRELDLLADHPFPGKLGAGPDR